MFGDVSDNILRPVSSFLCTHLSESASRDTAADAVLDTVCAPKYASIVLGSARLALD